MMRCLWSLLVLCALFCVSPVSAQTLLSEEIKEDSVTGQDVVEKAKEFIGVPYRYLSADLIVPVSLLMSLSLWISV